MVGCGGVLGSLCGGYLTESGLEEWCFALCAMIGFLIAGVAFTMSNELEHESDQRVNATFMERCRSNYVDIKKGIQLPELRNALLFFVIMGGLIPSFGDFLYYYQIEVTGFSQMVYSMLGVLGFLTLLVSTVIYNGLLKNQEIRFMMITACLVNLVGSLTTVLYTK
jgi:MFS family permease